MSVDDVNDYVMHLCPIIVIAHYKCWDDDDDDDDDKTYISDFSLFEKGPSGLLVWPLQMATLFPMPICNTHNGNMCGGDDSGKTMHIAVLFL